MFEKNKKRVFVALSGGVDSSVAALLLKKQGYQVTGVFLSCFNVDGCLEKDAQDALKVATYLKIPFYIFDFEKEYKKRVVKYTINDYRRGRTPNPDVMCNQEIKFGLFLEKSLKLGADYIATGHYVRLQRKVLNSSPRLRRSKIDKPQIPNKFQKLKFKLLQAKDKNKDQSYFLWTLTQKQLKHCLFPIGNYLKSEVREIARQAGLPTAEKKDSQGICFLGKVKLIDFLKNYLPPKRGPILTTDGQKIGEHQGIQFYTIGQRHLGIKFQIPNSKYQNKKNRLPYYVVKKDVKTNTLIMAEGNESPTLYQKEIKLKEVNLINKPKIINNKQQVWVRIRYRQPLTKAQLIYQSPVVGFKLIFNQPQKFITPGQSAVFYSSRGELLGGGVIE